MEKSQFNIFHGDCCAIMRSLRQERQIIDHIITDPPYAISQKKQFSYHEKGRKWHKFWRLGLGV